MYYPVGSVYFSGRQVAVVAVAVAVVANAGKQRGRRGKKMAKTTFTVIARQ